MKKIYLMLALAAGVLTSCSLDKEPYGVLPDDDTFQTPDNFKSARVSLYTALKACAGGDYYVAPELQCDMFNAVSGFSNTLATMYRWEFTTDDGTFSGIYGNAQVTINRANFIIDGYNKTDFSNENVWDPNPYASSGTDKTDLGLLVARKAKGEAFFTRAFALFQLTQYFCQAYDPATADNKDTGVSYTLEYNPTVTADKYPARKTLNETYQQIYNDLDSADLYVERGGTPRNAYISVDAIAALRARVALAKGDYELASSEASLLVDAGTYTLCSSASELSGMYTWDGIPLGTADAPGANEAVLQLLSASTNELPGATGTRFLPYQDGSVPDYIPTKDFYDMFSDKDFRKGVYFNRMFISTTSGAGGYVYVFNKFPDHGYLYALTQGSESSRFAHEPVLFRIAEMYLIAAEANAMLGNLEDAEYYLSELQRNRYDSYTEPTFANKDQLITEIRNERTRELACEGFHLFDLKRWHQGFRRGTPQQRDLCSIPGEKTTDMVVAADAPRFTWPIPKHEIDVNKQVKQNPGY